MTTREFDCEACGRHILSFGDPPWAPDICNTCVLLPGWMDNPELSAAFDPENDRQPRPDALDEWVCRKCRGVFAYTKNAEPNFCPYCRSKELRAQRLN